MEDLLNTNQDETEFQKIAQSQYNKINSKITKLGYSDGMADGKESIFQNGFDTGYQNGLKLGIEISKLESFAKSILKIKEFTDTKVIVEAKLLTENLHKFKMKPLRTSQVKKMNLNEISNSQNEEIDNHLIEIKKEYPNLCNLLN